MFVNLNTLTAAVAAPAIVRNHTKRCKMNLRAMANQQILRVFSPLYAYEYLIMVKMRQSTSESVYWSREIFKAAQPVSRRATPHFICIPIESHTSMSTAMAKRWPVIKMGKTSRTLAINEARSSMPTHHRRPQKERRKKSICASNLLFGQSVVDFWLRDTWIISSVLRLLFFFLVCIRISFEYWKDQMRRKKHNTSLMRWSIFLFGSHRIRPAKKKSARNIH